MNFEDWKQKYGLLKIECKQQEPEPWKGETDLRNKYLIDVEFKNGYKETIPFWDSIYNYQQGKETEDLKEFTLYCHLSDGHFLASEFIQCFEEYRDTLEGDKETYNELRRIEQNLNKYFDESTLINMMNELQDIYDF
jgi:hypothetical protein